MAAPHIPHLTSLRGTTRNRGSRAPNAHPIIQSPGDKLVQGTDNDASISRLNAATLGYLDDKFAAEFVLDPLPPRRLPIINRGTYMRTIALDKLVESFIDSNIGRPMQIISLGAGTDTRYWRLREKNMHLDVLYHEIDFPTVSVAKLTAIRRSAVLSATGTSFNVLNRTEPELEPERLMWGFFRDPPNNSQGYLFHPLDLRRPFLVENLLTNVPTLLISECCLCYLSSEQAQLVIQYFTSLVPTIGIAIYEPINIYSAFGNTMTANLGARGLVMPTLYKYPNMDKQMQRLRDAGFSDAQNGADMLWLWKNWITDAAKQRISGLEMLDELEEWELLASHYAIVWAWRELLPEGGAFNQWVSECPGQLPYPEELYWDEDEEGEEDEEGDEADIKIESIETDE